MISSTAGNFISGTCSAAGWRRLWTIRVSPAAALISSCRFHCIRRRKRERGFNQAELLALALHRLSGLPLTDALQRTRYTTTQTQFDRSERMENLRGAFRLRRGSNVQDLRMLLVDDVLTTGSTLSECASVLKKAGALSVHAATAARG